MLPVFAQNSPQRLSFYVIHVCVVSTDPASLVGVASTALGIMPRPDPSDGGLSARLAALRQSANNAGAAESQRRCFCGFLYQGRKRCAARNMCPRVAYGHGHRHLALPRLEAMCEAEREATYPHLDIAAVRRHCRQHAPRHLAPPPPVAQPPRPPPPPPAQDDDSPRMASVFRGSGTTGAAASEATSSVDPFVVGTAVAQLKESQGIRTDAHFAFFFASLQEADEAA